MSERKVALISGIAGQDGSYLSEHLLDMGYEVHGIVRRQSTAENQETRLQHLSDIHTYYGDLTDVPSLTKIVTSVNPTHIFNLGAMSHVRISFDVPSYTIQTNGLGVLNLLEIYRMFAPEAKFYQASSSEMFGNSYDEDKFQRESTAYNLHACNGILFNHESPRRGSNFVTNKVVKQAVEIKKGLRDTLELGNMDSYRDWGHAKDYTRAMIEIINHETPDEFCVSTGTAHSVRDLCEVVFKYLELDYRDYVTQNPKYMRPEELKFLRGDSTKAREVLGWKPEYTFEGMMHEMVEHWMNKPDIYR